MTRIELQKELKLSDLKNFKDIYLAPALAAGLVEMTIPDKPQSSKQKYLLTAAGLKLKSELV